MPTSIEQRKAVNERRDAIARDLPSMIARGAKPYIMEAELALKYRVSPSTIRLDLINIRNKKEEYGIEGDF